MKTAKPAAIATIGSLILGSLFAPAMALQMPEQATTTQTGVRQVASAYAEDRNDAVAESSILSSAEIHHIKWCAARYKLAYNPVDDTYAGQGGVSFPCLSPR